MQAWHRRGAHLPDGRRSAINGILSETLCQSSRVNGMPTARAIAMRLYNLLQQHTPGVSVEIAAMSHCIETLWGDNKLRRSGVSVFLGDSVHLQNLKCGNRAKTPDNIIRAETSFWWLYATRCPKMNSREWRDEHVLLAPRHAAQHFKWYSGRAYHCREGMKFNGARVALVACSLTDDRKTLLNCRRHKRQAPE
jgi:hypothetical protein